MNQQNNDVMEIDLIELLLALKKRAVVIILVSLLFAGAAAGYVFYYATPIYESTSKIYILNQSQTNPYVTMTDLQVGSSLAYDYQEMIVSRRFLVELKKNLGLNYSYREMKAMITITNPSNTRILNISVRSADSEEAREMANELAVISQRNISEIMRTDEPSFFEKAIEAKKPVEPEKTKMILIGFLIGFLLSAGIVAIRHIMDDRITSADDIERILGLPVLAVVPTVSTVANKRQELKKSAHKKKKEKETRQ